MVTTASPATVKEVVREHLAPVLGGVEENMREARQAILHGRHAAEGVIAETVLLVRRHPLRALVFAVGAGAIAGCLVGFSLGRRRKTA